MVCDIHIHQIFFSVLVSQKLFTPDKCRLDNFDYFLHLLKPKCNCLNMLQLNHGFTFEHEGSMFHYAICLFKILSDFWLMRLLSNRIKPVCESRFSLLSNINFKRINIIKNIFIFINWFLNDSQHTFLAGTLL